MVRLADEIRMTKPFKLPQEEAALNILRTSEVIQQSASQLLKAFDLTPPQYNVLRILRGAGADGLCCSEIAERMVTRDPDVTRLLDRLNTRNLIARERSEKDRRVVTTRASADGLRLLDEIDPVLYAHHHRQFANLSESQLRELIRLLEVVRETANQMKETE